MRRQPVLAATNLTAALLLALGLHDAVPGEVLAGWLAYMALAQAVRLIWWGRARRRWRRNPAPPSVAADLVTISALAGLGWGFAGLVFAGQGSIAEWLLVPFFLAGMGAGAVATLSGHLPTLHAFLLPALLPYGAMLGLSAEPELRAMGLATAAYAAGLGVLAWQAHRSARRAVELYLENGRLVRELESAWRRLEQRADQHAAELETVLTTVPASVWLAHGPRGERMTSSTYAQRMLRLAPGANASLTAPPPERPRHFRIFSQGRELVGDELPIQRAVCGADVREEELRIVFDDGTFVDELISASPVRNAAGMITGAVAAAIDITQRKQMEEALRRSEQRFRDFAAAASDWFWETDAEHRFVWISPNAEKLTGVPAGWFQGRPCLDLLAPGADPVTLEAHGAALAARQPFRDLEYRARGRVADAWLSISGVPVFDDAGTFLGYRGVGREIGERKRAEERIRHLALHDELTGLPNRHLLQDRLRQALALAARNDGHVAVLLLDLDRFKDVNDTLGHPAGDRLLREAALRLTAAVRASDTLARLGGDEFAVIQSALQQPGGAAILAQRLLAALSAPFALDAHEVDVGASVGIAVFPNDGTTADELIRRADLALYRAKHQGGSRSRFFEPVMDTEARSRRVLERELRRALDRRELVLHYQPQLELGTGRVTGIEALIRWRHPERGLVPPVEFIPLAEACGLILRLGVWVLDEACRQARAWQEAGLELTVAVNLSAAQLRHGGFLQAIDDTLGRHRLDPARLELEITESLLLERTESTTDRTLRGLAARRIAMALDDFGVGYSSLAYLKRLPVQKIKIDRSFVRDIGTDPEDEALVRAIVTLGHTLGKIVVAEGVETEPQLAFLRRLECDAAQGFLLGRPQEAAAVTALLTASEGSRPFLRPPGQEPFAVGALAPP